ncbi:phage holin [Lentibacillus sp. N15]|uniref:phage holin n=1 Tax=Lentibacillus songyuanensis TaxID=3136161 RepID=UPI0031BB3362
MESLTSSLIEAVFTVVGILLAAAVSYFTPKIKRWLDKAVDKDNLGIIESVVDMAVELMENEFSGQSGQEKFNQASEYVALMAHRYGIEVSDEFIRGAVQKGWRRMDEKQKSKE